jgi:hypothetical protein
MLMAGCTSIAVMILLIIVPASGRDQEDSRASMAKESEFAGVAQLVEHLICNQRVGGSNPFASSR